MPQPHIRPGGALLTYWSQNTPMEPAGVTCPWPPTTSSGRNPHPGLPLPNPGTRLLCLCSVAWPGKVRDGQAGGRPILPSSLWVAQAMRPLLRP